MEEVTATMESLQASIETGALGAEETKGIMEKASGEAQVSGEKMGRLIQSLDEIQKRSREASKIIKVIDDIAFQTNILSLNAAGEAGKGFAVVAEQVASACEVSKSMAQVSSIAQSAVASSEETAATGEALQSQANKTREVVMGLGIVVMGRSGERKVNEALEATGRSLRTKGDPRTVLVAMAMPKPQP